MAPKRKAEEISKIDPTEGEDDVALETPPEDVFMAPSISKASLLEGTSYTYHTQIPPIIQEDKTTECVLGVDEAGRGPVLGPMVYGICYLPLTQHKTLLADTHHFDDSKVLTPGVRSNLLQKMCTEDSDLYQNCGWATRVMSARDISAGMLRPVQSAVYNLNAQAMDATIALIQEVLDKGVNLTHIYIDTIGKPEIYQKKLEKIFPTVNITVAKKADSLYPCVSAASVAAKVTRDAALEVCWQALHANQKGGKQGVGHAAQGWGSGYPSDGRCTSWMKGSLHPLFGWGPECRFSWGTTKDMLDRKGVSADITWPEPDDDDDENMKVSQFFTSKETATKGTKCTDDVLGEQVWGELQDWYGSPVAVPAS